MSKLVLLGADCESGGHPSICGSTVQGTVQDDDGDKSVTVNGQPLMTHGDVMDFGSHGHDVVETESGPVCVSFSSHRITPDQNHAVTVNGKSLVHVGDSTTDPGSGGTASITNSGGNSAVTHTE